MLFNRKKTLITKVILSVMSLTPCYIYAAEKPINNDENEIEVVVITAQKRVQNILKVPITVGTVSDDQIEESGSVLLSEIDKFIPGFTYQDASMTQGGVSMRGISSPNISVGGDPSSATFYDDIYMPRAAQNVLFSDIERIEVLKGPQGTLFGRNAAMGVVSVVPKAPISDQEGFVKATYGTDNLVRLEGMGNVALSESVFIRANILSTKQDGFIDNVAKPSWKYGGKLWDLGEKSHRAARVSLLWELSDQTNFQLSYDWDDLEQGPPMAVGVSKYAYQQGNDPFNSSAENDVRDGVESRDMSGIIAKINHDFDNEWSLKYVVSHREWQTINREDDDGTADITRYFSTSNNENSNIFYTELQANYSGDSVNTVMGFSYSKEKVKQTTELNITADAAARLITGELNGFIKSNVAEKLAAAIGGNTDAHAEAAFGPGVTFAGAVNKTFQDSGFPLNHLWNADEWANTLNVLGYGDAIMAGIGLPGSPLTGRIITASGDVTYDLVAKKLAMPAIFGPSYSGKIWRERIDNTGEFTNWGIYADIDYAVTDKWNVIGGLRYSKDTKDFSWYIPINDFVKLRPGVPNLLFQPVQLSASDSWNEVTGRLVTSYQMTDKDMTFMSYSTGYKSGGFDSLTPSTQSFAPENTSNIEVGYKGIIGDSLVANFSAYYLELENLQRSVDSKLPGSSQAVPVIINEDRNISGLELDFRWSATDSLRLGLVTELRSTESFTPQFYNAEGTLIDAKETKQNASLNYTAMLDYMPDVANGMMNLHLDYVFIENVNDKEPGLESYKKAIPAYFYDTKNLSGRLSWTNNNETLEVGLWGKNLLNKRRMVSVGGLTAEVLGTPFGQVNRPREYGVDFKYLF